jgi:thiol-disulfide isomerase/thioredoxin
MTPDSDRPDVHDAAHAVAPLSDRDPAPPPRSNDRQTLIGLLLAGIAGTQALIGLLLAGIVGLIIFLFVHVSKDGAIRPGLPAASAECSRGQPDCLPEVSYVDTAGVAYKREALAGKVVLVNFWATWCHPCQQEIPDLSRAYEKYKSRGVVFFGVMTDSIDNQQLLNFQSDYEMTYPVVRANSDLLVSYRYPQSLPTTFVYDKHGKQVFSHIGALRERDLDSLLDQLVAQN